MAPLPKSNLDTGYFLSHPENGEEIVISGLSGAYPESANVYEFRDNLFNKKDLITRDNRRYDVDSNPEYVKYLGKVPDIGTFDAAFFGLSPEDADSMDVVIRKSLEKTIEAIFDAGINLEEIKGTKTGVFLSTCFIDHAMQYLFVNPQPKSFYGCVYGMFCQRIAHVLQLDGPNYACDSACSSSQYSILWAYHAMRRGQCENAIVVSGGSLFKPQLSMQFQRLGVLNYDGKCKCFSDDATGYTRSEAIIAVVLQKAKNARRIYSQIVHVKANCDGFKEEGITYPSSVIQEQLLTEFYEECGLDPTKFQYVEAHGTGTKIGDPEESKTIVNVYCKNRKTPLLIGSVKSNMGHSEPAAGLCSVTKAIIIMESGYITPNINYSSPRKEIPALHDGRLKVVTEKTKWTDEYLSVNSFGFGGANCHLLLKANSKRKVNNGVPEDDLPRLVCYSGRNTGAIKSFEQDLCTNILDAEYVALLHEAFKNNIDAHYHRGYTLLHKKEKPMSKMAYYGAVSMPIWYIFSGPGSQWLGMGTQLLQIHAFAATIKKCSQCLSFKNIIIEDLLTSNDDKFLQNHVNVMVGITAMQLALIDLLDVLKIKPDKIFGYSIGELACAYADKVLTLEQALLCSFYIGEASKNKTKESVLLDNLKQVIPHPKKRSEKWIIIDADGEANQTCSAEYFVRSFSKATCFKRIFKKKTILLEIAPCGIIQRLLHQLSDESTVKLSLINKERSDNINGLLKTLGDLYLYGHNPHIKDVYPKIQFPVSRGTRMISPLIKWNSKDYMVIKDLCCYSSSGKITHSRHYKINIKEERYLEDHNIDGRILYPAMGYLILVWQAFETINILITSESIVFEDVKLLRATHLTKGVSINFIVTIEPSTGHFEITEDYQIVVKGKVRSATNEELNARHPNPQINSKYDCNYMPIKGKDIYKELRLRGYKYGPHFRGIQYLNQRTASGMLKWDDNYITFMDTMIQSCLIDDTKDFRSLFVPTYIEKVVINKELHQECLKNMGEESCLPVYVDLYYKHIHSGGISLKGWQASAISRRKPLGEPVLETYKFVPNLADDLTIEESMRVIVQVALENVPMIQVKTREVVTEPTDTLSPIIKTVLEDLPLIQADTCILTKLQMEEIPGIVISDVNLLVESNCLLVILKNILDHPKELQNALGALLPGGFVVLRESLNVTMPMIIEQTAVTNIECILQHRFKEDQILVIRKRNEAQLKTLVNVSDDPTDLKWLPILQDAVKKDPNTVVLSEGKYINGILGLVNCIRKEPNTSNVRAVVIMDKFDIKFSLEDEFFASQLRKDLGINVMKEGTWGTYRHLKLPDRKSNLIEHAYVSTISRGDLSSLSWLENRTSDDKLDNTVVEVYYAPLNFRDVMTATGRIPPEVVSKNRFELEGAQGFEFSGRTKDGKRIFGYTAHQGIATDITTDQLAIWPVPDNWTLEEAATVPVVYGTVIYGLIMYGKIQNGQSILIHSGTGGIGQAAINIALHFGLTVFVTVGTQEKRDFIKATWPHIKDSHIGSSRDISFENMVMTVTNGKGVDYVLNSLAEEKLQASVRCLAYGGKFIEIGKFDLINDSLLNLSLFKKDASYGVILDQAQNGCQSIRQRLKNELTELMKQGAIKPLNTTIFSVNEIEKAFRYMGAGKHIGKILIKIRDEEKEKVVKAEKALVPGISRYLPSPGKTYIIAGGLGGFGLELTDWLVLRGARNIVLSSRTGISTAYQQMNIRLWKNYGVNIKISTAKINTIEGCRSLIEEASQLGPVEGIFNLAVVLQDSVLENQTEEKFETSFAPKAIATKFLDELSRRLCPNLKLFVVFSSVSCGRGNAGQTNYGMANSIMERICEVRKRDGLPALAVQWGAIGEVGLVAEMQDNNEELEIGGTLQQRISNCLIVLDQFLTQSDPIVSSMVVAEKRQMLYAGGGIEMILSILGVRDAKLVSHHATLAELGMDSITSVEIKNALERDFELFLSVSDIRNLTIAKLQALASSKTSTKEENVEISETGLNLLLRVIGDEKTSSIPVLSLPSLEKESTNKIIIVPGLEGIASVVEGLVENLKGKVLCTQYDVVHKNESIQDLTTRILQNIQEEIRNDQTFTMVGYSVGAVITLELAARLEAAGKVGRIVLIDGSPDTITKMIKLLYNSSTENNFHTTVLSTVVSIFFASSATATFKDKLELLTTWDEKVDALIAILPTSIGFTKEYQKLLCHSLYNKISALLNYTPSLPKLKSNILLIRPTTPLHKHPVENFDLSNFSENEVQVVTIDGNHVTVLDNLRCAESINSFFEK